MEKVQVIFGTGPVGQAVARALLPGGTRIRMINRSGKRPAGLSEAVEVLAGDLYQAGFTRQATRDAAVVYQCAQPEYTKWVTEFIPLQSAILEGAAAAGARLVIADNLYSYGPVDGPMREDLPAAAATRKGKVRAEAARQALAAHAAGRLPVAIGRASDFFGPAVLDSAAGNRMFLPAVQGKAAQGFGNLDALHTYTFIDDFGRGLATLGQREEAPGQAWHVLNAETVSTRRFIELIFAELGQPVRVSRMGKMMLMIGGLFIPAARESIEMLYQFEQPFVVDHSKFRRAFGGQPTPLREAIGQTVSWYKNSIS